MTRTPSWLQPKFDSIPELLKQHDRWFLWTRDGNGRKVPRAVAKPDRNIDATRANNWTSFEKLVKAPQPLHGPGFALGTVDENLTFAGIDLDGCRNPDTGKIDDWAWKIIKEVDSYSEVSPSGRGVKILVLGTLPEGARQGKVYRLEIYDRKRYFAITGHHLPGTPATVEPREPQLRKLFQQQQSRDLLELVKLFGLYISETGEWINIYCPWEDDHSTGQGQQDTGLHRDKTGLIDGFHCFHASHAERTLSDVFKLFGLKAGRGGDFVTSTNGAIVANLQENILRALTKLEITLSRDTFAAQSLLTHNGVTVPMTDESVRYVWFEIEKRFAFRPSKDYFWDAIATIADQNPFHPVKDYLRSLTWDGQPRINHWLSRYGGAKPSRYVKAISAIVLIAAVRRIMQPGCKYDEMLVLIGKQGVDKSTALLTLCPNDKWFSDNFPLNADAKQIIEMTKGKWLLEAAELTGMGRREVDHLKSTLSRMTDGPVRMAYGRISQEVPRQFIVVGTTNTHQFLKDPTGSRRFWPVEIQKFDIAGLHQDRDQLWAEATVREAKGESIRLDPDLFEAAAEEQESRTVSDPWFDILHEAFTSNGDAPDFIREAGNDRFSLDIPWRVLGIPEDRRSERDNHRIVSIMQKLNFVKRQSRGYGDDKKSTKRWCKDRPDTLFERETPNIDDDDAVSG